MASKSHRTPSWQALWCAGLILSLATAFPALAGDEPAEQAKKIAEPTRTVTVDKATLTWHRVSDASLKRAELATAYKEATKAHLTGAEPLLTEDPEAVMLPSGDLMLRLPTELIHTMFVGATGQNYCSDTTVSVKAAAVSNADGEGR